MRRLRVIKKWIMAELRVAMLACVSGGRLVVAKGKPLYIGRRCKVTVEGGGLLICGRGVYISDNCVIEVKEGASLTLGDGVYLNDGCRIVACSSIDVGNGVICGPNVQIYDHEHAFVKGKGACSQLKSAPVSVGGHTWLCANVVITSGCRVPARSIVAANSVVTHSADIEDSLYAGVPARFKAHIGEKEHL